MSDYGRKTSNVGLLLARDFFPTLEVCILTYSFHLPAGAVYLFWLGVRFRIEFWPTYGFVVLIISTLMEILVHTAMKYAPKNLEA